MEKTWRKLGENLEKTWRKLGENLEKTWRNLEQIKRMKATKKQKEAISEIMARGGSIPSGEWTYGSGRHISSRPIPVGFQKIESSEIASLKGFARKSAENLLKSRPRVRLLIVPLDTRFILKTWRKLAENLKTV